jgi:hypothetical protein
MPCDRIELLRILSNLDQSLAKIESVIEREQSYAGWQVAVQVRDKLEVAHTRAVDALRRTV